MGDIPITKIIRIDEPDKYKLHAARWNGEDQPLDVYVRDNFRLSLLEYRPMKADDKVIMKEKAFGKRCFFQEVNLAITILFPPTGKSVAPSSPCFFPPVICDVRLK